MTRKRDNSVVDMQGAYARMVDREQALRVEMAEIDYQSNRLGAQRAVLVGRLKEVEEFLSSCQQRPASPDLPRTPVWPVEPRVPPPISPETREQIFEHLRQAPGQRMTAKELAVVMKTPPGTASSRLAQIKKMGLLGHTKPYYELLPSA